MKSLSRVRLLVTPWTAAYQAPLSMGFSRQEYWSGVPLPSLKLLLVFFFFLFFNFYFLTLQYCIGFAIYQHESATGIHLFLILNPLPSLHHPSRSFQCTSPKHPASCIEPGLASRFTHNIIHVSMPFSQIIPPSPSPTESERLFYTSVKTAFYKIL